jgi:hypothetical protein
VPKPEPGEDALDHSRVFDQSDHAHLRAVFWADERIDLVDLANQLRPGGLRGLARVAVRFDAATGAISIRFQGAGKAAFFTAILGKQQFLDNGNLLVIAAHEGRVFEVAPDGALL